MILAGIPTTQAGSFHLSNVTDGQICSATHNKPNKAPNKIMERIVLRPNARQRFAFFIIIYCFSGFRDTVIPGSFSKKTTRGKHALAP